MTAALFREFHGPLTVQSLPDPSPTPGGAVIRVQATGICRSDWHGWMGHDADVHLPHVPGHEFSGIVEETGTDVRKWKQGDRVTVPFVCACGECSVCRAGDQQVCPHQVQPGFTTWGSFAQFVMVEHADENLVRLPPELDFIPAASLGCRLATSYRAVVYQARSKAEDWLAIHGCGGVGLSAIMIAAALGIQTVAIDIDRRKLDLARKMGATQTIDASTIDDVPGAIADLTNCGANASIDALGSAITAMNSINCLRPRGTHVQVGLMTGKAARSSVPFDKIVARELEIRGSHGMQAHCYPELFELITSGRLDPSLLVSGTCNLHEASTLLTSESVFSKPGIVVINQFT